MTDAIWHDAAGVDDVSDDDCIGVSLNGIPVVVARSEGEWFALHDLCPHGAAWFSEGYVGDGCIECPLHQGLVDLRTGAPRAAPISTPVTTYPVRLVDGRVQVAV
jgi:anthranilate 1,2-dioxygenase ferredoxin subunit